MRGPLMLGRPMAQNPRNRRYERVNLRLARFVVRNRFRFAAFMVIATLLCLYPIVNSLLAASGHRLPGPTVQFKSFAWPHPHTDPRRDPHEPNRGGHRA